jgi:cytochrome P450
MAFVSGPDWEPAAARQAKSAVRQFTAMVVAACTDRSPGVLGRELARAMREGVLTEADAVSHVAQIVTGALEPTTATLAAAVEHLTGSAEARAWYAADPATFLAETVRLVTPFNYAARRALCDFNFHGSDIAAGDRVVLVLAAAHRDPRKFPDPLSFRMDRGRTSHMAFGRGRHACQGSGLAMTMMRAALDTMMTMPDVISRPLRAEWRDDFGMRLALHLTATQ